MRYIVSVNQLTSKAQISQWASVGVEEFYFGYMPEAWVAHYGWESSTNRRFNANSPHLRKIEQVRQVIQWIHEAKAKAVLAINDHTYPLELSKKIVDMALTIEEEGADAMIIADPSLLMMLQGSKIRLPVHASVGLGVQNVEAVNFFKELGINRFVLPRKIRPDEIVSMLRSTPQEVEFEVFLLGEWCFYNDETCFCTHGHGKEVFCGKKVCGSGSSAHEGLDEPYDYAWCGLCLAESLSRYHDRIIFKIPMRENIKGSKLIDKVLKTFALPGVSKEDLIKVMQCEKKYCAYEFK